MKKFSIIIFFILGLGIIFNANAREAYVENKSLCEKTKGVWRAFNNSCADVCGSKFEYLVCTSVQIMDCDCGVRRCWDGGKCITDKLAKVIWDKKNEPRIKNREAEIEDLEKRRIAVGLPPKPPVFDPENNNKDEDIVKTTPVADNKKTDPTSLSPTPKVDDLKKPATNEDSKKVPLSNLPPVKVINSSPEKQQENLEDQKICESQNGSWQTFNNGCVDSCASKVSKVSMCSQSLTKGCKCGGSKCWDVSTKTCTELEDYKISIQAQKNNEDIKVGIDKAAKMFDSIPFPAIPTF